MLQLGLQYDDFSSIASGSGNNANVKTGGSSRYYTVLVRYQYNTIRMLSARQRVRRPRVVPVYWR